MVKSGREASNCWPSLLIDQYHCNPMVYNEMEKKLTLERFQREVRQCVLVLITSLLTNCALLWYSRCSFCFSYKMNNYFGK